MSFMLESAIFSAAVILALLAALGLMLVLFLLNTSYLGVKAASTPYPVLHFFSEALFPSLKILLFQILAFFVVVYLVGFISIPISCLAGFFAIAVLQIYIAQKQLHHFAGKGSDIWSTKLLGMPTATTILILCIPTACLIAFVFYGLAQAFKYY